MKMQLNRNFIIPAEPRVYYSTLIKKIESNDLQIYNVKDLIELFAILENDYYKHNNLYEKYTNKLRCFTEEFVLTNSWIINQILKLSEEERKIILIKSGYKYTDDMNLIDLVYEMQCSFENIIYEYLDTIFNDLKYDKTKILELAKKLKNGENKEFIGYVTYTFICQYSFIKDYAMFAQLFTTLNFKLGDLAYNYIINKIKNKEAFINSEYKGYHGIIYDKNLFKKIKKEQCGSIKKLY